MDKERPIEKLLRRHAKKRQDDAGTPPDLHPATRRMFQGEVASRYPQGRDAGQERKLRFWRQFKLALAVVALLAIVTMFFIPTLSRSKLKATRLLALDQPIETRGLSEASDLGAAKTTATHSLRSISDISTATNWVQDLGVEKKEPESPSFGPMSSPQAATPSANAALELTDSGPIVTYGGVLGPRGYYYVTNTMLPSGGEVAAAPPAPTAQDKSVQTVALSDNAQPVTFGPKPLSSTNFTSTLDSTRQPTSVTFGSAGNNATQKFMNSGVAAKDTFTDSYKKLPAAAVLNNFSLEQDGSQLRVIDGDGSTYSGSIQVVQAAAVLDDNNNNNASAPAGQIDQINSQAPQSYFFSVSGTNLTLKALVIFTGNLTPLTNPGNMANQQQNATQPILSLQNSSIVGKARIGNGTEVDVNAVPVSQK
jgi:hypothetical protein